MKLWKRILAVAVVAVAAGVLLYFGIGSNRLASLEVIPDNALISRPTINLWYTDEALGDYLGSVALDFPRKKCPCYSKAGFRSGISGKYKQGFPAD